MWWNDTHMQSRVITKGSKIKYPPPQKEQDTINESPTNTMKFFPMQYQYWQDNEYVYTFN